MRFVALPAGQDPDDLVNSGGREAVEALLASPEPLVERLWRYEVESAPLDTPEARAGLKQRLMEHSQAIDDPSGDHDAQSRPARVLWQPTFGPYVHGICVGAQRTKRCRAT